VTSTHTERISRGLYELPTKEHALYRFYDRTDALLYVGITMDLPKRFKQHRKGKPWWLAVTRVEVEHFDTRGEALGAEKTAIKDECPLYNDQHNEFVEVVAERPTPAEPEPSLPIGEIFRFLRSGELAGYLARAKEYSGDTRGDAITANAARLVVDDLTSERSCVLNAMQQLIRTWPDCVALREKVDHEAKEFDFHQTEGELLSSVLKAITRRRELGWLDSLSCEERDEWLACAATAHGLSVEDTQDDPSPEIVRAAYDYYADYRDYRWLPERMCCRAGRHGARCPKLITHRVYFLNCPLTECQSRGQCDGHSDLCARHLDMVRDGRIRRRHDGSRFTIERCEDLPPAERFDEAPF
jgi:predicted GIY-YIG superfamily endonuclease